MKGKYQSAQAEDRTLADKMMTIERYKSYSNLIGFGNGIWEVVIDFMIKKSGMPGQILQTQIRLLFSIVCIVYLPLVSDRNGNTYL